MVEQVLAGHLAGIEQGWSQALDGLADRLLTEVET